MLVCHHFVPKTWTLLADQLGAGAGGASTAYYLRQFAQQSGIPVDISVFERESYIGGRSTTVNVFDDPAYPVELGAAIFVEMNYNLMNASKEFGLNMSSSFRSQSTDSENLLGIWNGEKFVFMQSHSFGWWERLKLLLRYGLAPIRTKHLVDRAAAKFSKLYEPPLFPFSSLTSAVVEIDLHGPVGLPGNQLLAAHGIQGRFPWEVIQASTRVNYGQNLALIHGLETLVCMATEGAFAIPDGNWRIFASMLKAAGAKVNLNTTVTAIDKGHDRRWTVSYTSLEGPASKAEFDEVVIAAPFQSTGISVSPRPDHVPEEVPYVTLHVTLFASPHRISPQRFNLSRQQEVPDILLTTLPEGEDLGLRPDGVGPAGFWSISRIDSVPSPVDPSETHHVYKVFSPERLTASFIASVLGVDAPQGPSNLTINDLPPRDVSWFHEKTWQPYPYEYPRQTFEPTKLAPNLWYTSGIENLISTMETSSLMGKDIAALMVNEWEAS